MAVAAAVALEVAFVVAAARDRAVAERNLRNRVLRLARMLNADLPGCPVGMRADDGDIAAELNQAMPDGLLPADFRGAVGRVLFDEAAEVELHACQRQYHARTLPAQSVPANQCQHLFQRLAARDFPQLEVPGAAQYARRDIEQAVALLVSSLRVVEQSGSLGVYFHARSCACAAIDAHEQAVLTIARVLGFQPAYFRFRARSGGRRGGLVFRVKLQ